MRTQLNALASMILTAALAIGLSGAAKAPPTIDGARYTHQGHTTINHF